MLSHPSTERHCINIGTRDVVQVAILRIKSLGTDGGIQRFPQSGNYLEVKDDDTVAPRPPRERRWVDARRCIVRKTDPVTTPSTYFFPQ